MIRVLALLLAACASLPGQGNEKAGPTVVIRLASGPVSQHQWSGDRWLEQAVQRVSQAGGGVLDFAPGVYQFARGLRLRNINKVHFRGSPGTVFRFRKLPEIGKIKVTAKSPVGDKSFEVDHPELLRPDGYYQVFMPDLKGNRKAEFEIAKIEGSRVTLKWLTNVQIKAFEPGMHIIPSLNFFESRESNDLSFTDIEFDGNCDVANTRIDKVLLYGHTMHCGILLRNRYLSRPGDPVWPGTRHLRVNRCVFRRILGRGVTAYNTHDINVSECRFEDVGAESVEIDHLASNAVISGCVFIRSKVGVQFNDASDSIVIGNVFDHCKYGINVNRVLKNGAPNARLVVHGNSFKGGHVAIRANHIADSVIASNVISGPKKIGISLNGSDVNCTGNTLVQIKEVGIQTVGNACRCNGNIIRPAKDANDFRAVSHRDD